MEHLAHLDASRHGRAGRPVRHSRGFLRAGPLCVAAFARSPPGPPLVARRRRAALSTRSELSPLPKSGRLRACAPWSPTVNPIYKWMGIVLAVGAALMEIAYSFARKKKEDVTSTDMQRIGGIFCIE